MRLLLAAALVCAASAGATASKAFCRAANDGKLEAVKKSIRDGADIHCGPAKPTRPYVASTASIGFFFSAGTALASVSAGATPAARAPTLRSIAQASLIIH